MISTTGQVRGFLERAWQYGRALGGRAADDPMRYMRWLPGQDRVRRCPDQIRLYRGGNQVIGKTTVGLAEIVENATGTHPHRPALAEPGEYWVVCASWSQSVAIQKKLYALIPKHLLHPDTLYDDVRGFRNKNPAVRVKHIPSGGWAIIRFKTTQQGTLNLAGATINGALFDEPPSSPAIFSEVLKRVQATGGWVLLTLTPVGAPVDWLRTACEAGQITDIHIPLTPDQLIPVGSDRPMRLQDGTVCDADYIQRIVEATLEHEVPVRVHGEWEMRATDRVFSAFRSSGDAAHVHEREPEGETLVCLGFDHGSKIGKQCAVLVLVTPGPNPSVYVLDEDVDETGSCTPEEDAKRVLAMLKRHRIRWQDVDYAYGDRVYMRGPADRKSNRDLVVAIAKELRVPVDRMTPQIRTVKRGAGHGRGSKDAGIRWLHHAMLRKGGFGISKRCTHTIAALDRWDYRDDDFKDKIDAVRYALDHFIFTGPGRAGSGRPTYIL